MNIILISQYAGSAEMGELYRPYFLARQWARAGDIVTIFAADYAGVRLKNPRVEHNLEGEEIEGVSYRFVKVTIPRRSEGKKGGNIFRFERTLYLAAKTIARQYRPDVVIMGSIQPFDFYPARLICRESGAKLVYDMQDIYAKKCVYKYGYSEGSGYMRLIGRAERAALRGSDRVVYTAPNLLPYLEEKGVAREKTLCIPNGFYDFPGPEPPGPQRQLDLIRRCREKGMFCVMYLGGFFSEETMETFIESARLAERDVVYFLVGNGPYKILFKRFARQQNISNLFFLDGCAPSQEQALLAQADCLYYGVKDSPMLPYELRCDRLYQYMLSGKPILYATTLEQNLVERVGCGVNADPADSTQIARAVVQLHALSPRKRSEMGERGRRYCLQHHDYRVLAERYRTELLHLSGRG